jgi:hypothetical protein
MPEGITRHDLDRKDMLLVGDPKRSIELAKH